MTQLAVLPQTAASLSVADSASFDHIQRVAKAITESQLVPDVFKKNIPNAIIALELANRMGAAPLMVMQNLHVIHGKPSFSAQFMIGAINASKKFSPLRFTYVGEPNTPAWGCFAHAKSTIDNEVCTGVTITMAMADAEGWTKKTGSKWKTMPQLMLSYRAATWWCRMYSPEMLMGFPTEDEAVDIAPFDADPSAGGPATLVDTKHEPVKRRSKGLAEMKTVTPDAPPVTEPAPETTTAPLPTDGNPTPPPPEEPKAEPAPGENPAPPPAQGLPLDEAPDMTQKMKKVRCELVGSATTKNPAVFEITLSGDYKGTAYHQVQGEPLPANGAILDLVLEEVPSKRDPSVTVHKVISLTVVG